MDNLEEMDTFLEMNNLLNWIRKKLEIWADWLSVIKLN